MSVFIAAFLPGQRAGSSCITRCSSDSRGSCLLQGLGKASFLAGNKCSVKQGVDTSLRGLGWGSGTRVRKKTSSRMMALGDKQPLTCELLLEGNRIFPALWFLHVLLITFISKSFSYSELLMWGHMCFSRNCFL